MSNLAKRLVEADLRIEWMIPLFGLPLDAPPTILKDLIQDDPDVVKRGIGVHDALPRFFLECLKERDFEFEIAYEVLCEEVTRGGNRGVFLFAAQPVFQSMERGQIHYSWGYYNTQLFYGDTFDAALRAAVKWGEERHKAALKKGKANA